MSIRFTETFFIDIDHSYALSQRADIINYVPTVAVFPHRTHVYLRCMEILVLVIPNSCEN